MLKILDELQKLIDESKSKLHSINNYNALQDWHKDIFGKYGIFSIYNKKIKDINPEDRAEYGKNIQTLKMELEECYNEKAKNAQKTPDKPIHDTYKPHINTGTMHPLNHSTSQVIDMFLEQGYEHISGGDIDTKYNNFDFLNTPLFHPSRHDADTFYLANTDELLLRTQTTSLQNRAFAHIRSKLAADLKKQGKSIDELMQTCNELEKSDDILDVSKQNMTHENIVDKQYKIIMSGNVYRRDSDATHSPMFSQFEGLILGNHFSVQHLKGWIMSFVHKLLPDIEAVRFRPSFFPFTYCSAEIDIRLKNQKNWLELLGCGIVHPKILARANIPSCYQAIAFGMGLERLTMLKYQINNIKLMHRNDPLWLSNFGYCR